MRSRSGRESSQSRIVSLSFPLEDTRGPGLLLPGRTGRQSCPGTAGTAPVPATPSHPARPSAAEGWEGAQGSSEDPPSKQGNAENSPARGHLVAGAEMPPKATLTVVVQSRDVSVFSPPQLQSWPGAPHPPAPAPSRGRQLPWLLPRSAQRAQISPLPYHSPSTPSLSPTSTSCLPGAGLCPLPSTLSPPGAPPGVTCRPAAPGLW